MSGPGPRPPAFVVPSEKLTHYLLVPTHPEGGSKARFFLGYGFSADQPEDLAAALLTHAAGAEHVGTVPGRGGIKFVFEGPLDAPNGKTPRVRSVWQIDEGADPPARFITAVPL